MLTSAAPTTTAKGIPAGRPIPERTGAAGSTRGTISCGHARCKAPGEACFFDQEAFAWTCRAVPPPTPATMMSYEDIGVRCDDGLDCPDGETCCLTFGHHKVGCVKRAEVPTTCQAEICIQGGARCPVGKTCVPYENDEGSCKAPEGPATCAGKRRCPEDKPICAVADGRAFCVAKGSPEYQAVPGHNRYRCTRQSDCQLDEKCQFVFGEIEHEMASYCGPYKPGFMGTRVCEPLPGKSCRAPTGELAKLLPWMGGAGP